MDGTILTMILNKLIRAQFVGHAIHWQSLLVTVFSLSARQAFTLSLPSLIGIHAVGQLVWVLSVAEIAAIFILFGGGNSIIKYLGSADFRRNRPLIIRIIVLSSTMSVFFASVGGLLAFAAELSGFIHFPYIALAIAVSISFQDLLRASLKTLGHPLTAEILKSIVGPAVIFGIVFILSAAGGHISPDLSYLIGSFTCCVILLVFLVRELSSLEPGSLTRGIGLGNWIKRTFPVFCYSFLFEINAVGLIVVLGFLGTDKSVLGTLAVVTAISKLCTISLSAANISLPPLISQLYADKKHDQLRTALHNSNAFSILILTVTLPLIFVLGLLYLQQSNNLSAGAFGALCILLIGQTVNVLCGSAGFTILMTGKQWAGSQILFLSSSIQVLILALFEESHSVMGAALLLSTGLIVSNVGFIAIINRTLGFSSSCLIPFSISRLRELTSEQVYSKE